jgi:hypothetical protein
VPPDQRRQDWITSQKNSTRSLILRWCHGARS